MDFLIVYEQKINFLKFKNKNQNFLLNLETKIIFYPLNYKQS